MHARTMAGLSIFPRCQYLHLRLLEGNLRHCAHFKHYPESSLVFKEVPYMADFHSMRAEPFPSAEKACYVLILLAPAHTKFRAWALGVVCLPAGAYAYAGSAKNGLDARVGRYLRPERARRWHIDYLLDNGRLREIVAAPCEISIECDVSRRLMEQWPVVPRFGSGDCRCPGHLFGPAPLKKLRSSVYLAFSHCGFDPCPWEKVHKTRRPRVRKELP